MDAIDKYLQNLKYMGIESPGAFIFNTLAIGTFTDAISNKAEIKNEVILGFTNYNSSYTNDQFADIIKPIFYEYYLSALMREPNIKKFENNLILFFGKSFNSNSYDKPVVAINDSEYSKYIHFDNLLKRVESILDDNNINDINEIMKLGVDFSRYFVSNFFLAYNEIIIMSNIVPSAYSICINILNHPDDFMSSPNTWFFSKELRYRLSEKRYGLDNITQEWIWLLHNAVFYVNEKGSSEIKEKYINYSGFHQMISDVLEIIIDFNNSKNLESTEWEFDKSLIGREIQELVGKMKENLTKDFGCYFDGEFVGSKALFHSYQASKFINLVLLCLRKNLV